MPGVARTGPGSNTSVTEGVKRSEARRRKVIGVASRMLPVLLIFPLLASGCGGGKRTGRVRIGYLANDLHQLAFRVAEDKGFFSEEGVEVAGGSVFNAGPEEMSAFSAGKLDMGYVGLAPAVTFTALQMADVRIVAQANEAGSAIVVRSGLEAEDAGSLKGRTVAVPGHSTVQDFLLRLALKKAGVSPGDVDVVTLEPSEMINALSSGRIDAFIAWEPYPSQAVYQNAGRVLLASDKILPHHSCCVLVADSDFLRRDADAARRVVAAHVRATEFINENPEEASDMAHLLIGIDREVAGTAVKNIDYSCMPETSAIERYVRFLIQNGVIATDDPASFTRRLVDPGFLSKGAFEDPGARLSEGRSGTRARSFRAGTPPTRDRGGARCGREAHEAGPLTVEYRSMAKQFSVALSCVVTMIDFS